MWELSEVCELVYDVGDAGGSSTSGSRAWCMASRVNLEKDSTVNVVWCFWVVGVKRRRVYIYLRNNRKAQCQP